MVKLNCHFEKLSSSYLFLQIEKKVKSIKENAKDIEFINLGIGDITKPLPDIILEAMVKATLELKNDISKAKYGPALGFSFLRNAIAEHEYGKLGICGDEIFVSNGAKCDIANIQEIFAQDNIIAICDPTYPVYIDSNVMAGRSGPFQKGQYENIVYLPCLEENNFFPQIPNTCVDLIYLCSPNNPTGVALTYEELEKWVSYAMENNAIIIFDGAYEAFIQSDNVPHSIYEIENAKKCAIEIRSFSKKAGFTGLRCSYTVIPFDLKVNNKHVRDYWIRRSEAKFGGIPYPIQKAALETFSDEGKKCTKQILNEYFYQMKILTEGLDQLGLTYYGGKDAPYVWVKSKQSSWEFFDRLLKDANIISIPGIGFGSCGEGFVRLSAFAKKDDIKAALKQLKGIFACTTQ